jgi:uncharacterized iron-regulated protein
MQPLPRRRLLRAAAVALAGLQWSCAATAPPPQGLPPVVLLGEVHDNPAQPARQLDVLRDLLRDGTRPALLLEQFDRERQADIDRARAAGADAQRLIEAGTAGGASRWEWSRYRPLLELALANDLPIVAANVSRADARKVIAEGLAPHGFDARVPPDMLAAQAAAIERSHCGTVDAALAQRMALAQVARDQYMARQVDAHAGRGVLLIAGHGHVRRDIGVPRWLTRREGVTVIGLVEAGSGVSGFDRVVTVPMATRTDPCESLRTRAQP